MVIKWQLAIMALECRVTGAVKFRNYIVTVFTVYLCFKLPDSMSHLKKIYYVISSKQVFNVNS